jgi:transposase-like protein
MGYSNDLRVRVIEVVEGGAAARTAARQFVIGDSTAIRWVKRWRETGSFEARSNKGQSRSTLKKHEEWLLKLVRREADLTLESSAAAAHCPAGTRPLQKPRPEAHAPHQGHDPLADHQLLVLVDWTCVNLGDRSFKHWTCCAEPFVIALLAVHHSRQ